MQYIYLEMCSLFEAEEWVFIIIIIIIIIIILISGHFALPLLFICFNIYRSVLHLWEIERRWVICGSGI